jgi:hypothetical protein
MATLKGEVKAFIVQSLACRYSIPWLSWSKKNLA